MARPEKVAVVDEIRDKLAGADAAVLTEYRGLSVRALADLRAALRPAGTEYKVFKNTLARRAVEGAGVAGLADLLEGPVAIAFVRGDAVLAAKAMRDFARANPALVVKGGLLGGRLLGARDLEALADVPPRDVLLARLAGGFQAPLTKAAGLFQAFTRNFAYGLKAYIDTRPADGEAAAPAAKAPAAEAPAAEAPEAAAPAAKAPAAEAPAAEAPADEPPAESAAATETEAPAEAEAPAETE
jgi:large subunit ribosomal protein L10